MAYYKDYGSHYHDETRLYRQAKKEGRIRNIEHLGFKIRRRHSRDYRLYRFGEPVTYKRKGAIHHYRYATEGSAINRAEKIIQKERDTFLKSQGFTFEYITDKVKQGKPYPNYWIARRYGYLCFGYANLVGRKAVERRNHMPIRTRTYNEFTSSVSTFQHEGTSLKAVQSLAIRMLNQERLLIGGRSLIKCVDKEKTDVTDSR